LANVGSDELRHLEQLLYEGRFPEASEFAEQLEKQVDFLPTDQLRCQILKSELSRRLGQFRKAFSTAEKAFKNSFPSS
jgi:hypothetical protein